MHVHIEIWSSLSLIFHSKFLKSPNVSTSKLQVLLWYFHFFSNNSLNPVSASHTHGCGYGAIHQGIDYLSVAISSKKNDLPSTCCYEPPTGYPLEIGPQELPSSHSRWDLALLALCRPWAGNHNCCGCMTVIVCLWLPQLQALTMFTEQEWIPLLNEFPHWFPVLWNEGCYAW